MLQEKIIKIPEKWSIVRENTYFLAIQRRNGRKSEGPSEAIGGHAQHSAVVSNVM